MASTRPRAATSWRLNSLSAVSTRSVDDDSARAVALPVTSDDPATMTLHSDEQDMADRRIAPNTPVITCPNSASSASRQTVAGDSCGLARPEAKPSGRLRAPRRRACRESIENIGKVTLTVRVQTVNAATTRRQFHYRRRPQDCRHEKRINRAAGRVRSRDVARYRPSQSAMYPRSRARPFPGPAG